MELAQVAPWMAAIFTALATVISAFFQAGAGAPREVRLISKLAEATHQADSATEGGAAVDRALAIVAEGYASKVRARQERKVNGGTVAAVVFVGFVGAALVYGLTTLAIWLADVHVVLGILGWLLVFITVALTVALLTIGGRTIYDPPKPRRSKKARGVGDAT